MLKTSAMLIATLGGIVFLMLLSGSLKGVADIINR